MDRLMYGYGFEDSEDENFYYVEGHAFPKWANYSKESIRTRREAPYSYSTFLLAGPHKKIEGEGIFSAYSDRMRDWDYEAWNRAWDSVSGNQIAGLGLSGMSKWLTAYYNKPCRCLQIFESCNVSNGYPLWYFIWEEE